MPIVTYHLVEGRHTDGAVAELLRRSCALFAEELACPVDRVRAFAHEHRAPLVCVGGDLVADGAEEAPYFHFMLLEGRPLDSAQRLLAGFTDLLVETLGVERSRVRGGMWPVEPERWAVGGVPAATVRRDEVAARRSAADPRR
ncbi:MAG: tautomerase family protein [Candidatus Nanopelagicales bacterium]